MKCTRVADLTFGIGKSKGRNRVISAVIRLGHLMNMKQLVATLTILAVVGCGRLR